MQQPSYSIRRATFEDVPWLRSLWKESLLPADELEKRFIEFQVVFDEKGDLLGAIGLTMMVRHGHLHSEAYLHPEMEETLRPLLWERVMMVARNHGLVRFWTLEEAPFWKHFVGFKEPLPEELERMPAGFGDVHAHWTTLKFADETIVSAKGMTLDEHLAEFRQAQEAELEKMKRRASQWKKLATVVVFALFCLVVIGGVILLRRNLSIPPR
jgi:N-acetylglutamate synthase-like GNAT family acetyltransferase